MLRGLKFKLKRKSLEKLYIGFIRPLLEYSHSVWDNCNTDEINQLESVQTEACRIITGSTKYCNKEKMLQDLHWESLRERRRKHRLILFYKMVHKMTPEFLSELVPPSYMKPVVITSEMPTIFSQYMHALLCSTIRSFKQPCEIGIIFHSKFDNLKACPYLKTTYLPA